MKKLVVGILAHVDAGKTTLSEGLLYLSGKIRKLGRVDHKDAYLDTYALERERGITIFSKQALLNIEDTQITLLDTPGHIDFSAEMERTLQVLDYAIVVVSGTDGVQGHTQTLWQLLKRYDIPTFVFVNKMDQPETQKKELMAQLEHLSNGGCVDFSAQNQDAYYDQLAMCNEEMMQSYLEDGEIEEQAILKGIQKRAVFPCFFGSALKLEGVEQFMKGLVKYTQQPCYQEAFGAKIFKIGRDEQGMRLTHMKITGGALKMKDVLSGVEWEEKVNQIRLYSGEKFEAVGEVEAGDICAVVGLTQTKVGEGLGVEEVSERPMLEAVLSYQIILPPEEDVRVMLPKLKQLEEEDPELRIVWNEELQEIQAQIMGEVQIEVLQSMIKTRFGIMVTFGEGSIVYKETIANVVEGVGHFEPLRHYSEVHILLEPGEPGSGIQYNLDCSEDLLERNWQRLVLSHMKEKMHRGVLTGSAITDLKMTLVTGRAHKKHTEGGDFREATYRAIRQGLKQAQSILLEPYYQFKLEVPERMVGRAMTDIERMKGLCEITGTDGELTILEGSAPVVTMRNYQKEVIAYTKGYGRLFYSLKGYLPCHNAEEVIKEVGYDSERDVLNPTSSVFCSHGTGFLVSWDEVKDYMHIESVLNLRNNPSQSFEKEVESYFVQETVIDLEEIDTILNKTFYANQGEKSVWRKKHKPSNDNYHRIYEPIAHRDTRKISVPKQEYLLVDGYNIIFAWEELRVIAEANNIEGARIKLLDLLSNYQGIKKCKIIVVFDAYRVPGGRAEIMEYLNVHMVYTREAQTADHYIERFVHEHQDKYQVTVATSDGLEQIIIRGKGCGLLSARELKVEMERANNQVIEDYKAKSVVERNYLSETLTPEIREQLEKLIRQ